MKQGIVSRILNITKKRFRSSEQKPLPKQKTTDEFRVELDKFLARLSPAVTTYLSNQPPAWKNEHGLLENEEVSEAEVYMNYKTLVSQISTCLLLMVSLEINPDTELDDYEESLLNEHSERVVDDFTTYLNECYALY